MNLIAGEKEGIFQVHTLYSTSRARNKQVLLESRSSSFKPSSGGVTVETIEPWKFSIRAIGLSLHPLPSW